MDYFVVLLWSVCFLTAVLAPLRWGMVAFLCISAIDFNGGRGSIDVFNVLKGIVLPIVLLWRTRAYSGHTSTVMAAIGWMLLTIYVGIAGFWSLFPMSAGKLVAQMTGTLMTTFVLVRAAKGGFLTAKTAVYAAVGALTLGVLATYVTHGWGDEVSRFSAFMSAQGYASFLAGLFCILLCGRGIPWAIRMTLCLLLTGALIWDGSRTWFMGIALSTCMAVLLSRGRAWLKIMAFGFAISAAALIVGGADTLFGFLSRGATGNRIVAAVTAAYAGDTYAAGLGTFNFRKEIDETAIDQIEHSSWSQVLFGRGTCNGAIITGTHFRAYARILDPNRMFHNEWLRVLYEWGIVGCVFWLMFVCSLVAYTIKGVRLDPDGDAKPLLVYMPSFFLALSTENILAGSVNAVSMAFLLAIALATIPHREYARRQARRFASGWAYRTRPDWMAAVAARRAARA